MFWWRGLREKRGKREGELGLERVGEGVGARGGAVDKNEGGGKGEEEDGRRRRRRRK